MTFILAYRRYDYKVLPFQCVFVITYQELTDKANERTIVTLW